ncbi:LppU/SCO3897 family protein [Micromonospora auratinigra]|uniref:Uncharacterized protein n=1 Tax=Micromonospora auratinigra TaxID=261654 RepID=A0A1A9A7B6_9ACTN|nr:hypothetical protein [Micromonospora auratinigra]SBT52001.1 hypothetical protein GA0070611_5445 [Micromonospora auratinigra]
MPEQAAPGTEPAPPSAAGAPPVGEPAATEPTAAAPAEPEEVGAESARPSPAGAVLGVLVLLLGLASVLLVLLRLPIGPGRDLREAFGGDGTAGAAVGDCVAELPVVAGAAATSADDARVVSCAATDAAYSVVGRVRDAAAARDRSATGCRPYFRTGDEEYVLYRVGDDGDGYLLCLVRRANGR